MTIVIAFQSHYQRGRHNTMYRHLFLTWLLFVSSLNQGVSSARGTSDIAETFVDNAHTSRGNRSNITESETRYSSWLSHYEEVKQKFVRKPSESGITESFSLAFNAFNETYKLYLAHCPYEKPQVEIVKSNGEIVTVMDGAAGSYYCGYDAGSSGIVHGYIDHGVFVGVINAGHEHIFIERKNESHSLVYRSSDVRLEALELALRVGGSIKPVSLSPNILAKHEGRRTKRAAGDALACGIHAFADYSFFAMIGLGNLRSTVNKIYFYILTANSIFTNTDFNGDGASDNIGVVLHKVTIVETPTGPMDAYLLPNEKQSDAILTAFSTKDHNGYCLTALFMYRDLDEGVLGLAWQASSNLYDYPGGICQDMIDYGEEHYSYNTFLVTTMNYGRKLPDVVTALTTTHELGHAFGSPHDDHADAACAPGGFTGVYLMYPYSTDSTKINHWKFSRCSTQYISPTITNKGSCFIPVSSPRCGDGIIQGSEQCDCGFPADCPTFDQCCVPVTDFTHSCQLYNSSRCSPAASLCCTEECRVDTSGRMCSRPSECMNAAFCSGVNADCPAATPKLDGSLCSGGTALCFAGFCSVSRCSVLGLQACSCRTLTNVDCQLCCKTSDGQCLPSAGLGLQSESGGYLYLPIGSSCRDNTGICHEDHRCLSPNKIDTINRMKDIFRGSTYKRMLQWLQENWCLVLILVLIVVFLLLSSKVLHKINSVPKSDVLAKQTARLLVLWQQAQFELGCIDEQLAYLDEQLEKEKKTDAADKRMDINKALERICTFFPTATRKIAAKAVLFSLTEQATVEEMLRLGHPMVELPVPGRPSTFEFSTSGSISIDRLSSDNK